MWLVGALQAGRQTHWGKCRCIGTPLRRDVHYAAVNGLQHCQCTVKVTVAGRCAAPTSMQNCKGHCRQTANCSGAPAAGRSWREDTTKGQNVTMGRPLGLRYTTHTLTSGEKPPDFTAMGCAVHDACWRQQGSECHGCSVLRPRNM